MRDAHVLRHVSRTHDYGLWWVWISVCGCVYGCESVCAALHVHTCAPCMPPCMIAFKHAFAAFSEERSTTFGVWACEGVCILRSYCPHAHPQLHSTSLLLTCVFPNSEISACSRRKSANNTTDCLPSYIKLLQFLWPAWREPVSSHLLSVKQQHCSHELMWCRYA